MQYEADIHDVINYKIIVFTLYFDVLKGMYIYVPVLYKKRVIAWILGNTIPRKMYIGPASSCNVKLYYLIKIIFQYDVYFNSSGYLFTTAKCLRTYNVMALSASSVEIWFPTNNLSCGWRIVMKFWYINANNHKRKAGIDF